MSHYKPYPDYKESGVEWIGMVPGHWDVKRLRHIATFTNSSVDKKSYDDQKPVKLCNYTDVYYNEFITASLSFMDATASDSEINAFALKKGDVLITKDSEDPSDIGIPALVSEDMPDVICGYHLTMIRTRDVGAARFAHRSIQSHPTKAHFFVESPGITRYGLDQDAIGDIQLCMPPAAEQQRIVSLIDRETIRIDALIAKKTRFIELLKEKRQALITHAVTKGLDPNVKMKDSGVEWIGEVPEHWQVAQVRRVVRSIEQGWSPECSPWPAGETEWGVLKAGCVNNGEYRESENKALPTNLDARPEHEVRAGDVLMSRASGTPEFVGSAALICATRSKLMLSDKVFRIHLDEKVSPHFFVSAMSSRPIRFQIENELSGGNGLANNLPQSVLVEFLMAIPPIEEQVATARFITAETQKLGKLAAITERSIALLKERRSALITAAVTGQIDLRSPRHSRARGNPETPVAALEALDSRLRGNDGGTDGANDRANDSGNDNEASKP